MKVVVSEAIHEEALALLEEHAKVHHDSSLFKDHPALKAALRDADALIVRNGTRVNGDLVGDASNLRVVGRLGVGLDNLELPVLKRRGVTVTWAPGTNAVSVAEYVMGAMLESSRRFASVSESVHEGVWDRGAAMGTELYGKTLGIVGLGDIGSRLAKRAHAFGMKVLANDPVVHESTFGVQEYGVDRVTLEALLQNSDFVSLHAPLLPSTRGLINAETLRKMKPTALLINTAQGWAGRGGGAR